VSPPPRVRRPGVWFWVALLLAPAAWAVPVIVLRPVATGEGMPALGAELAAALDRVLPNSPYEPLGGAPSADELATAFNCAEPDEDCLRRAARAAGASWALVARLTRAGAIIGATLERLPGDKRIRAFRVARRIDLGRAPLDDVLLGRLARILADDLLAEDARRPAAIVAAGTTRAVEIDGQPRVLDDLLLLAPGRYEVARPGGPPHATDLLPGELAVVDLPPLRLEGPSGRRIAAWTGLAVGVGSLVGAGIVGAELAGTQSDYDRAKSGNAVREYATRGDRQALTANVLLGVGAAALVVAGWLFWD